MSVHDVHIWYRETESLGPDEIGVAEVTLSADERARCDRFLFTEDRRDYAVAHDLLRRSLSRYGPVAPAAWQFDTGQHGKPFVKSAGQHPQSSSPPVAPSFSLSHTRGLVACAIASNIRVGVDVERLDRKTAASGVAERVFSARETAALQRCHEGARALRFVELWTLKEAYVKAIGLGLLQPLGEVTFELEEDSAIGFIPPRGIDGRLWHFAVFAPSPYARMSVAACGGDDDRPRFIARASGGAAGGEGGLRIDPLRTSEGN